MQIPGIERPQQRFRKSGTLGAADNDKEAYEKDQQPPINFVINAARLHGARDQQYRRT